MVKKDIRYWLVRFYRKFFVKPTLFNRTYAVFLIDEENNLQWNAGNFWLLKEAKDYQKQLNQAVPLGIKCRKSIIMKIFND